LFISTLVLWYAIYELIIKPSGFYDAVIIDGISGGAIDILKFLGEEVISVANNSGFVNEFGIIGYRNVRIGPGCDGLVVMALFAIFIAYYPGKIGHKTWYIPVGLLLIYFINVLRVVCLALILKEAPDWLDFNHDYTFTIIIYGLVFWMWYIWIKKFSQV